MVYNELRKKYIPTYIQHAKLVIKLQELYQSIWRVYDVGGGDVKKIKANNFNLTIIFQNHHK